jgi:hypothetical protein
VAYGRTHRRLSRRGSATPISWLPFRVDSTVNWPMNHLVHTVTNRDLVPVSTVRVPEPPDVDNDYRPVHSQSSMLYAYSPTVTRQRRPHCWQV